MQCKYCTFHKQYFWHRKQLLLENRTTRAAFRDRHPCRNLAAHTSCPGKHGGGSRDFFPPTPEAKQVDQTGNEALFARDIPRSTLRTRRASPRLSLPGLLPLNPSLQNERDPGVFVFSSWLAPQSTHGCQEADVTGVTELVQFVSVVASSRV